MQPLCKSESPPPSPLLLVNWTLSTSLFPGARSVPKRRNGKKIIYKTNISSLSFFFLMDRGIIFQNAWHGASANTPLLWNRKMTNKGTKDNSIVLLRWVFHCCTFARVSGNFEFPGLFPHARSRRRWACYLNRGHHIPKYILRRAHCELERNKLLKVRSVRNEMGSSDDMKPLSPVSTLCRVIKAFLAFSFFPRNEWV